MGTTVFITRAVDEKLWQDSLGSGTSVTGRLLIDIAPLPFTPPASEWIFFYSKNGVKHFFEQYPGQLTLYKWAAIGPKTAEVLLDYVTDVDFVGDGDPQRTAAALDLVLEPHETVCFVRAKQSRQSVQSYSQHEQISDIVVYDNKLCSDVPSGPFDIVIFTSPLNVEAYLTQHSLEESKVIAIGSTTAAALREKGHSEISVPTQPTEAALLDVAVRLIHTI